MPQKRLVKSFEKKVNRNGTDTDFKEGETHLRRFGPEIPHGDFYQMGLDSELKLGKGDLEKLGYPERIKVVLYSIDD